MPMHSPEVFYKYTSSTTAKIILATQRLRWSSPLLFNDPFDITQNLRLSFTAEELNAALTEEMIRILESKDGPPISADPRLKLIFQMFIRNPDAVARKAVIDELHNEKIGFTPDAVSSFPEWP